MGVLVAASFLLAAGVWGIIPPMMASHWNIAGEVDGFAPKALILLMTPVMMLAFVGLFRILPKIDPYKENIAEFRGVYDKVFVAILAFLFYIYLLTIAWNLGYAFDMTKLLVLGFAALFYIIGWALAKTKRNWFLGVRTPWTLSSEKVWGKTHRLAANLFIWLGTLTIASLFYRPEVSFGIVVGGAVAVVIWLFIYSYSEFKREHSR